MIDNTHITERVMRMGIEFREGVPYDQLWDLAIKQLTESARLARILPEISFDEWRSRPNNLAFMYRTGNLEVVRVDTDRIRLIEWRSRTMPLIEVLA